MILVLSFLLLSLANQAHWKRLWSVILYRFQPLQSIVIQNKKYNSVSSDRCGVKKAILTSM